ncbi:MAG: ABC transporter ATP-binding protein [Pyrinomonadaceae bacterium]
MRISLVKSLRNSAEFFSLWRRAFRMIWDAVPLQTTLWGGLILVQGILPGLTVYLTKLTIDSFMIASGGSGGLANFSQPVFYFVVTGVCLLLIEVFRYFGDWNRIALAEYFTDYLKNQIHRKSAEVDLEFYESPEYHDLMEQARGESSSKPIALLESFGTVAQNFITLVSFAALLLAYGWTIPLLLVVGTLPGLFVSFRFDRIYHKWWKQTATDRRWLAYFDAMLSHSNAAAEMRLFGLGDRYQERFQTLRRKLRIEKFSHLKRQFVGKMLANVTSMAAATLAVGWIALGVIYRTATLGDLAVFIQVFTRGQSILRGLLGAVGQTVNNTLYLESLFAYLDLGTKLVSPGSPRKFPEKVADGIRLRDVSFRYPGESRKAISAFDLFIPAGKTVAIVGVNGAGKSTLIKLLCRFYDPTSGSIEIDGTDIREFDVAELRQNLSVLFQFPLQFHETAAQNIELGDTGKDPDVERRLAAAEKAGIADFIGALPDGYETLLGKWFVDGVELSGGEWQKIALARAYFRRAPIVILDEPTSFMDPWSEVDWFDRFRSMISGQTGIVITHRFTIAMRADIIHVIDGGEIVESGTHQELLKLNGLYATSWKAQMLSSDERGLDLNSLIGNGSSHVIVRS